MNAAIARDVSRITSAAGRLQAFCERLASTGSVLPLHLFIRPLQAEIVFARPAIPMLARLFGGQGWQREAAGAHHFDWVKRVEEGVTLRISGCEEASTPPAEVPTAVVEGMAAAER